MEGFGASHVIQAESRPYITGLLEGPLEHGSDVTTRAQALVVFYPEMKPPNGPPPRPQQIRQGTWAFVDGNLGIPPRLGIDPN